MAEVVIYTKPGCPYCIAALTLLERKGVAYREVVASNDPDKRAEMIQRAKGRATYPQIFVGETHVGGNDDMQALERAGKLDALLAA